MWGFLINNMQRNKLYYLNQFQKLMLCNIKWSWSNDQAAPTEKSSLKIALNHQDSETDQACIAEKHDT